MTTEWNSHCLSIILSACCKRYTLKWPCPRILCFIFLVDTFACPTAAFSESYRVRVLHLETNLFSCCVLYSLCNIFSQLILLNWVTTIQWTLHCDSTAFRNQISLVSVYCIVSACFASDLIYLVEPPSLWTDNVTFISCSMLVSPSIMAQM